MNLSQKRLSDNERKVLEWAMKFAPAPKKIPNLEMVAQVEDALLRLKHVKIFEADRVRATVANAIIQARPPKSNVRKEEREALRDLRNDSSIVLLEADKGNSTVVMDAEDYEKKALDLIEKPPFKKLAKDPTKSNEKRVNDELKRLMKGGCISQKTLMALKL